MATSAPSARHRSSFSGEPAVASTRAPTAWASWMAKLPMPPAPPWTRNVSPERSPATIITLDHTVPATSGSAAAVVSSTPSGIGISCPAGTATRVAYPPPARRAHTSSPTAKPSTPSPSEATVPLHSSPMISDAPGGGGYKPCRWSRSARLTAVAVTSSTTSPGPATGSGTSTYARTSGPPGSLGTIALTRSLVVLVAAVVDLVVVGHLVVHVDLVGGTRRAVPALRQTLGPSGQPLDLLDVRIGASGSPPEQERGDRRSWTDHVLGRHLRQVEDQRLVDLGLDVEDVTQLVDPVVQVHGLNLAKGSRGFKCLGGWCLDGLRAPAPGRASRRRARCRHRSPRRRRRGRRSTGRPASA